MIKKLWIVAAAVLLAAACQEKNENEPPVVEVTESGFVLEARKQEGFVLHYTVKNVPESYYTRIVKVEVSDSWVYNVDCTSQAGIITFDIEENSDLGERYALIEVSAGTSRAQVPVTQRGGGQGGGQGGTTDGVWRKGWAELPAEHDADGNGIDDNDKTLYYAHHICAGEEKNAQRDATARNYSVCFSSEHHCPVWIAALRHNMYEGSASRSNAYGPDPKIPSSIQYQQQSAGNSTYNRGHMLGSEERTCSSATNRQVFYYTNIAPQETNSFNTGGGAWNKLEDWVDGKVCSDTTYIVIGTYFKDYNDPLRGYKATAKKITYGGRSDVSCPTMFYYAILRTKKGNTGKSVLECSADEIMCAAFVRSHTCAKGTAVSKQDMMSISDLEKITGFNYFVNVPNAPKDSFNASDWGL